MGQRLHFGFVVFASFLATSPVCADNVGIAEAIARTKTQLLPRPVTLKADKLPLSVILKQLQEQTGNIVVDRRQEKTDPALTLALRDASFWPALDAVARGRLWYLNVSARGPGRACRCTASKIGYPLSGYFPDHR